MSEEMKPGKSVEAILAEAKEAFWGKVAQSFPSVKSGDFPMDAEKAFGDACQSALIFWLFSNLPANSSVRTPDGDFVLNEDLELVGIDTDGDAVSIGDARACLDGVDFNVLLPVDAPNFTTDDGIANYLRQEGFEPASTGGGFSAWFRSVDAPDGDRKQIMISHGISDTTLLKPGESVASPIPSPAFCQPVI